jgi:hypothetical protein
LRGHGATQGWVKGGGVPSVSNLQRRIAGIWSLQEKWKKEHSD